MSDPRFIVHVTPEMIRHSRILDILYFSAFAYGIIELVLLLALRISSRMRDLAARVTARPFFVATIYVVLFTIVTAILDFPLSYYAGYVVPHQFKLTGQTFPAWFWDETKGLMIGIIAAVLLIPAALLVIRKFRRWWLGLWLASIPLTVLIVVIVPVVVDPVFNKFEPLKDQVLKQKLLDEAARAGIEGSRVYQVDKSRQTHQMNAYVTGLGPTKRIVMWDTLLAKMNQDEVLAVMGHEMGHYVLLHVWQGVAASIIGSFFVLFLAQRVYEWGIARWGARWRVAGRGDPASLPWLLIIISTISFLGAPVENGISRYFEHQADVFGLELTHLNDAMATSFIKFAEDSKVNPNPSTFIEIWRYSHPSLGHRIDFVLQYKPWDQGKPNELWRSATSSSERRMPRSRAMQSAAAAPRATVPGPTPAPAPTR
ncbi:MAG TPA: M48 family metallopeptidase [Thermoanaerobaculia bacterium]